MYTSKKNRLHEARKDRVRRKVYGTAQRPRMVVFRSNKHVYVQIVDDDLGHTLASASTLDRSLAEALEGKTPIQQAEKVGELVAGRSKEKNIETVVFDRNGYKYHGAVKALADAARKAGIKF